MSVDKLVDSTQLDAALESVADAIRAKSGGSSQLAFPSGFVSEIGNIPSGGGGDYTASDFADRTKPEGDVTFQAEYFGVDSNLSPNYFAYRNKITKLYGPNFRNTANINGQFRDLDSLKYLILPANTRFYNNGIYGNDNLLAVDCQGASLTGSSLGYGFNPKFNTFVIRGAGAPRLDASNAFNSTPFASNGAGGTVYCPQFMIAKFQATTNWSTYLGYAKNNIVALEGSPYESKYVDGVTDVPTKTITQNLTNCTSSYSRSILYWRTGYQITITPDAGYTMSSVVITRDGTDISSVYDSSTGKATFTCLGNVVITATATAS